MKSPKHARALLEVMKKGKSREEPAGGVSQTRAEPAEPTAAGPSPPALHAETPLAELDGPSLRISLTSTSAAVVVGAVLLALWGVFELGYGRGRGLGLREGRASYAAKAMDEIELARSKPPAPHLLDGLRPQSGSTGVVERGRSAGVGLGASDGSMFIAVPGYNYVVVQGFDAGRDDDAVRAQEFLTDRDVVTVLKRFESGAMHLIAVRGFNPSDPVQKVMAAEFLSKIHALGRKYRAAGGGYALKGYLSRLQVPIDGE